VSDSEREALRSLTLGGFRARYYYLEGFMREQRRQPLHPSEQAAVDAKLVEPTDSGDRYRITAKGLAGLKAEGMPTPMFVRGRCGWQGMADGHFVLQTTYGKGGPQLRIPSPLPGAPWDRSGGIFSNSGAVLSRECVEDFRDQLTAWLEEHSVPALTPDEVTP
jgi:hypothetical protein